MICYCVRRDVLSYCNLSLLDSLIAQADDSARCVRYAISLQIDNARRCDNAIALIHLRLASVCKLQELACATLNCRLRCVLSRFNTQVIHYIAREHLIMFDYREYARKHTLKSTTRVKLNEDTTLTLKGTSTHRTAQSRVDLARSQADPVKFVVKADEDTTESSTVTSECAAIMLENKYELTAQPPAKPRVAANKQV